MSIIGSEPDVYFRLIKAFPLLPIESDEELDRAIAVINSLLDKPVLSPGEQGYLDVLSDLVEKYESTAHPMQPVSDGEMLRHLIEAKGVTEIAVSRATKIAAATISDVLSDKRQLTRPQIAKLANYFCVDPTVFHRELPQDGRRR
ncbi:MAG TPA: helix-turn-helix domain-containing protein [Pirellulales bacterium]|nr:helix-turn-helix domain-containing protein [Pirellulales bacterium]